MRISYLQAALALALVGSSAGASAAIAPHDLEVTGTIRTPQCIVTPVTDGIPLDGSMTLSYSFGL